MRPPCEHFISQLKFCSQKGLSKMLLSWLGGWSHRLGRDHKYFWFGSFYHCKMSWSVRNLDFVGKILLSSGKVKKTFTLTKSEKVWKSESVCLSEPIIFVIPFLDSKKFYNSKWNESKPPRIQDSEICCVSVRQPTALCLKNPSQTFLPKCLIFL